MPNGSTADPRRRTLQERRKRVRRGGVAARAAGALGLAEGGTGRNLHRGADAAELACSPRRGGSSARLLHPSTPARASTPLRGARRRREATPAGADPPRRSSKGRAPAGRAHKVGEIARLKRIPAARREIMSPNRRFAGSATLCRRGRSRSGSSHPAGLGQGNRTALLTWGRGRAPGAGDAAAPSSASAERNRAARPRADCRRHRRCRCS
jgi:hypothetical protein